MIVVQKARKISLFDVLEATEQNWINERYFYYRDIQTLERTPKSH